MKIGLAQMYSKPGDSHYNGMQHLRWIANAAAQDCDLVVFPEMSLTGYLTSRADQFSIPTLHEDNLWIQKIICACKKEGINAMIGLPYKTGDHLYISLCLVKKDGSLALYHKQHLHEDEKPFFSAGNESMVFTLERITLAPAICYESFLDEHFNKAWANQPFQLYLSSVAKPEIAMNKGQSRLKSKAETYQIITAIVNAVGPTDDFINGGGSTVWNSKGDIIGQLNTMEEDLLTFTV